MLTSKSPRKVMKVAYELGRRCLPQHTSRFSRRDFTLPQLFACLVVREHQKKSYRGIEALLLDSPHWCREIGMRRVPDHNTLCRAWGVIVRHGRVRQMLDLLTKWFEKVGRLGSLLAVDASYFEAGHASRYYEQRCRRMAGKRPDLRGSYTRATNLGRLPKLAVGVDARDHAVQSAVASTGARGDGPAFESPGEAWASRSSSRRGDAASGSGHWWPTRATIANLTTALPNLIWGWCRSCRRRRAGRTAAGGPADRTAGRCNAASAATAADPGTASGRRPSASTA
jgi:hypothetical protein